MSAKAPPDGAVLVTGAASGMGRAAALRLARRMPVIAVDRNGDAVAATVKEIASAGGRARAFALDVRDAAAIRAMKETVAREMGPVSAAFNCAGISRRMPAERISEDDWDDMIDIHVKGTFLCTQAVIGDMVKARRGAIVNMSSDFAVMGIANFASYAAAKAAIYSLTKSLALEFAPHGIRVNAVGPGPIDTNLLKDGRTVAEYDATVALHTARIPLGRLGRPEEVAAVVDFLLDDRSGYMTGQLVHINGGLLSW
ncbi:MAG: SDR family oxidoreductase [Alphaproteobacteria bacterium]|nr:SDR family oxidoreductase [Alphaproteobacteria bacterium]